MLKEHFESIKHLYGDTSIQMPNSIFKKLSSSIKSKNGNTNIQQVAFAYSYLVVISFLYKYAHFVDVENSTYIQNNDIKELLGYNRSTKTIDKVIKKGGILDSMCLTNTTKEYPVQFTNNNEEKINGIPIREFAMIDDIDKEGVVYNKIKSIVKNRNYEIKEPLFMTEEYEDNEYGTLYSYANTHTISIDEFLIMTFDDEIDNIDFLMYGYFKSKCRGFKNNMRQLSLNKITTDVGMDKSTFYKHLQILKEREYIDVNHKGWRTNIENIELNEYFWRGVI